LTNSTASRGHVATGRTAQDAGQACAAGVNADGALDHRPDEGLRRRFDRQRCGARRGILAQPLHDGIEHGLRHAGVVRVLQGLRVAGQALPLHAGALARRGLGP
jgi:hypothetical protein